MQYDYKKYTKNFKVDANTEEFVLEALRNKDLSWPFGVTKQFENKLAKFLNSKYVIAHCNGTSAMYSAMFGVGVGPGTEVICPTYTFWASIAPAVNLGARVVFCDIRKDDLLIDVDSVKKNITPRTKAIVVPHLWGRLCDIDRLNNICKKSKQKIYLIEDASHCFGAKYKNQFLGTLGDVGIFSLQAGKPLVTGEGGILATDNYQIYDAAMYLGHYERIRFNKNTKYKDYARTGGGYKFRMHPLAAALGLSQLKSIGSKLKKHNELMAYFEAKLDKLPLVRVLKRNYSNFEYGGRFGLRVVIDIAPERKQDFINQCIKKGLLIEDEYISLLHLEKFFIEEHNVRNVERNTFRNTEKIHKTLVSLPLFYEGNKIIINSYIRDFRNLIKNQYQLYA
jgi:dTDP-4-amino-4,6-dideoxygalactose transaminase